MIKPTIGRVVLVYRGHPAGSDQPEPALVTYIHNDYLINVGGFTKDGHPFAETSLQLLQDDNAKTGSKWAEWMPYQKQAAEKAEKESLQGN